MKKQISVASLVLGIGGAVTFLFSFLDFKGSGDFGYSAWGDFFFPVATIAAVLGLAAAVVVVLELVGTKLPDQVLTFNWKQIKFTWGVVAAVLMLGFLIQDSGGLDLKIGGIFMLLGSIAMAAGATMGILGKGTDLVNLPSGGGSSAPSAPSAPAPPPPPGSTPPPPPPGV